MLKKLVLCVTALFCIAFLASCGQKMGSADELKDIYGDSNGFHLYQKDSNLYVSGNYNFELYSGGKTTLNDYMGEKYLIVNIWATTCTYCIQGIPDFVDFESENNDKVRVIYLNSGETRGTIDNFLIGNPQPFNTDNILLDESKQICTTLQLSNIPICIVFGPDGRLLKISEGKQNKNSLQTLLNASIAANSSAS